MTHASLFSGIGGFDLAAEWIGWNNKFWCEIEPFCQKILKYYFPTSKGYEDIKTTDFRIWRGKIDVLTGGFPCQPFSNAGKRKGTEDNRYLWPEMLRAIKDVQPGWIVGENVLGIVNWSKGMVFEQVCIDLENQGYEVQPFVLPACGINAPHRRERVFFIAYSHSNDARRCGHGKVRRSEGKNKEKQKEREWIWSDIERIGEKKIITNTKRRRGIQIHEEVQSKKSNGHIFNGDGNEWYASDSDEIRLQRKREIGNVNNKGAQSKNKQFTGLFCPGWEDFPTQPPICCGDDGFSSGLDGITFSKWRSESIKAYGNAIVPHVAYQIFESINKYENGKHNPVTSH